MFIRRSLLAVSLLVLASTARAEVLLLVHGWRSNADTWLAHGVVQSLATQGWHDAGAVFLTPEGTALGPNLPQSSGRTLLRATLQTEAPLTVQASQLLAELAAVRKQYPGEPLWLVGHSAGGLVARLALVSTDSPPVTGLITLASPNLGTPRAFEGLDLVDSKPFFCPGPGIEFLKELIGGDDYDYLKSSLPAIAEMTPAQPGSLIDWLNRQTHPQIAYHGVVRTYDDVVPAISQDLNNVPALRGRAYTHPAEAGHELNPVDGLMIDSIVSSYKSPVKSAKSIKKTLVPQRGNKPYF